MSDKRLEYLLERYMNDACSESEQQELAALAMFSSNEEKLKTLLDQYWEKSSVAEDMPPERSDRMFRTIVSFPPVPLKEHHPVKTIFSRRWAAAAAIIIIMGVSSYFIISGRQKPLVQNKHQSAEPDIAAPREAKATITLSDGKTLAVDSMEAGVIARQSGVSVSRTADGKIKYDGAATELVYNTLFNPRGSRAINMTLSDGSRVWLNVGSSLKYPVAFTGGERRVFVTGEAYFEIAPDSRRPFFVNKENVQIEVLGTHFNVNTYDDESSIRITLLEGAIKVNNRNEDKIIRPGQQANVTGNIEVLTVTDPAQAIAWKDGKFQFGDDSDIGNVMRQVSKWYDVDIKYNGAVSGHIGGTISRSVSLQQLLKILETTDMVHFKIEGRTIQVFPR